MRYALKAAVRGTVLIGESISVDAGEFQIRLDAHPSGLLKSVFISLQVPPDKVAALSSSVSPGRGAAIVSLKIGGDRELRSRLVTQLQILESHLGFVTGGALISIDWANPDEEFIPETEEDQGNVPIRSVSYERAYDKAPVRIPSPILKDIIKNAGRNPELTVPQAFFREGMNFFRQFRYALAFYHFYFILEDFFAHGKSSQAGALAEFARSAELNTISTNSLALLLQEPRHKKALTDLFAREGCELSTTGLYSLLFRVRGDLHHYSSRSTTSHFTPFDQAEFESITLLAMLISGQALANREPVKFTFTPVTMGSPGSA